MSDNLTQDAPAETADVTQEPTDVTVAEEPAFDAAHDPTDVEDTTETDSDADPEATVSATTSGLGRRALLEREGEVAADFLETLLDICDLDGDIDVASHRAERRAALVTIAKEAIDEVRSTGERKALTPMSAFERKVVHDEVLAAGLASESEGAEPRRFVVILPA